jgi:hypothetical protein
LFVKILANFAPKIAKLVEITLEKHIFENFPDYFLVEKEENIRSKKKALPPLQWREQCQSTNSGIF